MAAKKTISQSQTQWVKKGDKLSDGTVAKKGYVARKGNDTKKVTANVRLSTSGDSANSKRLAGKKVGDVVKAQPGAKKSTTKGGGVTPAQAKAKAVAAKSSSTKPTSTKPTKTKPPTKPKTKPTPAKPKAKTAAVKKDKMMADKAKSQRPRPKPLIKDTSKDSTKPRSSYDAQGKLYHEMFYLGQWRRVKQNSDGKWMPTTS